MGKKMGTNEKVENARDRKASAKASGQAAKAKQEDDSYWDAHANPKGKKDVKKEEQVGVRIVQSLNPG